RISRFFNRGHGQVFKLLPKVQPPGRVLPKRSHQQFTTGSLTCGLIYDVFSGLLELFKANSGEASTTDFTSAGCAPSHTLRACPAAAPTASPTATGSRTMLFVLGSYEPAKAVPSASATGFSPPTTGTAPTVSANALA